MIKKSTSATQASTNSTISIPTLQGNAAAAAATAASQDLAPK